MNGRYFIDNLIGLIKEIGKCRGKINKSKKNLMIFFIKKEKEIRLVNNFM